MKLCQRMNPDTKMKPYNYLVITLLFLVAVPAYSQRATLGVDAGQTSDKFGGLARNTSPEADVEGHFTLFESGGKTGEPDLVVGGEALLPADTSAHAPEFAAYAGPEFWFGKHFSAGFHTQVRKIYVPSSEVNGLFFNRYKMLLFELPAVLEYRSSAAPKHAFIQAQVSPEFSPHFQSPTSPSAPKPNLDHGYTLRGSAGYTFGKWYAKATYETRYFQFKQNLGNPNSLNNWRTDLITGGIGFVF